MAQWYEELFTNYARTYENETFTHGTMGEVDFIEKELGADKSVRILDVGCGTGRHSIELARRGYAVTGVDLSENMLERAREKARDAGVEVAFIRGDARKLSFSSEFGCVLTLCEGGFSLMETDEMNFLILESASRALKPGGIYFLNALNALFPLHHNVKEFMNESTVEGTSDAHSFDLLTFRDRSVFTLIDDAGNRKILHCNERYYAPSEIRWMLHSLGFGVVDIMGSRIGDWSRDYALTADDYEMLVLARKLPVGSPLMGKVGI